MVMDPRLKAYSESFNGFNNGSVSVPNQNFMNVFKFEQQASSLVRNPSPILSIHDFNPTFLPSSATFTPSSSNFLSSSSSSSHEFDNHDSPEDCDFNDTVLKYIGKMLMEEDMEDKTCMFQESSALQATEKPFYEILGEKYPPSPNYHPLAENSSSSSNSNNSSNTFDGVFDLSSSHIQSYPFDYSLQPTPQSNGGGYFVDGLIESPSVDTFGVSDLYGESQPVMNFNKGFEEASKFLPNASSLFIDLESNRYSFPPKEEANEVLVVKEEKNEETDHSPNGSRGRKNLHRNDIEVEEGRSNKHSAVSADEPTRSELDKVLLCLGEKNFKDGSSSLREIFQAEVSKNILQNGNSKGSSGGKSRGKKQGAKKDVVDLRTLLIHCAQAVAADDRRTANELLKQVRQHSSPFGDGNQRLAHWFADGLEARLVGTGSQTFSTLFTKKTSAADILKAYQLYLDACPFKKMSNFFSNQTFLKLAENATRIHIVDIGIYYGFQWPCLLEKLSKRPGGPPKVRITGIDFAQPGFRPAERVEETGRRLSDYAKSFDVPFEYHAIAQKWETVQLEDINIQPGELLMVNCMNRLRNLLDETVVLDSPRNAVLKLIRKMKPAVFVHGIVNGAYSAPFFITRFREALFHYSSMFDMFETCVPREHPERIVLERDLYGREALNVIACEGSERVERPETYKQWQIRNMRAGFAPVPLNKDIMDKACDRVKTIYHKDFVVDQDGHWMLLGWKGRIIHAISAWRPVQES